MLDHLGLFVPDLGRAADAFARLGFRLTPPTPQRHRLAPGAPLVPAGTANRLAVLRQGYVELLAPIADTAIALQLRAAMARYVGLHLIAFGSSDAAAAHRHLEAGGFAPQPVIDLERTVELEDGSTPARFSVVRVPPGTMAEGRVQYCQHHTPEAVWQAPWLDHPNGAMALSDLLLCVDDPAEAAERHARFVGRSARGAGSAWRLELDRGRLTFTDRRGLARALPALEVPGTPFMAAVALTTADPAATRRTLEENGLQPAGRGDGVLAVPIPDGIAGAVCFLAPGARPPWLD